MALTSWSAEELIRYSPDDNTEIAKKEISVKTSVNSGITIKETEEGGIGGLLLRGAAFMSSSWWTPICRCPTREWLQDGDTWLMNSSCLDDWAPAGAAHLREASGY